MRRFIRLYIVLALLTLSIGLIYYTQFVLKTDVVYSHFFYLPIICAGFWWGMQGIGVAFFLSVGLILSHFILGGKGDCLVADFIRAGMFITVGITVAFLRETNFKAEKRLKEFSTKMLSVREEEKKRTAIDLHDELGSMTVAVNSNLDIVEEEIKSSKPNDALRRLKDAKDVFKRSVGNLKRLAIDLRPPELDILSLDEILTQYCKTVASHSRIKVELSVILPEEKMRDDVVIVLYRIVQEALTNIVKHSRASVANINVLSSGADVKVDIRDNGEGFGVDGVFKDGGDKTGIEGMRQRVESLSGEFEIKSEKKKGCHIRVVIPQAFARE